ncbi:fucose isomerase, partial [Candidatus Aerophobetes bacterium]|nr:fucose isomerase [Candidatus Aerophobetes bacterium]
MNLTVGLIVGNRDFFPGELARKGREIMMKILQEEGFSVISPSPEDTRFGVVETWEDAKKCAALFKENQEKIDGIIVTLPNFSDEKAVADTIHLSGLKVPVLVHAFPDDLDALDIPHRGDSFCGKISVCNNLNQYDIPFSLTRSHTISPQDTSFKQDLNWFCGVCRIVKGWKNIKLGAIGARPGAFNTVRFSEKILQSYGISVETIDLSDIYAAMNKISDENALKAKTEEIESYCDTKGVPPEKIKTLARFGIAVEKWMRDNDLIASAIQCWTSLEKNLGIMPCTIMSMMSEKLLPSACEVDITGALAMYALGLASNSPSALVDWNNNYGNDPDKAVIFHCGNFARSIFEKKAKMSYGDVIATSVGQENAYGSLAGKIKSGPFTYARFTTDDVNGCLRAYVGEGQLTQDEINTFWAPGVIHIPRMQELLRFICKNSFEHHV